MNRKSFVTTALALTVGLGIGPGALAQDEELVFEEVIVTATKREQSAYDVPLALSVFSGAAIQKQGITDLVDVGKFVPNLNVTTFSAGHTSSANPFIRGIGLQDHLITTDPGVSVYLDGVYLGRQVGQNWNLTNIERLEVLRGPQGTLYGRNSIGGAINIITRQPGDAEEGRIGLEGGTRGRVNADFYTNLRLSDTVAASVSGAFKSRNGVGEFPNLPNAEADVGELQDISARIAIKWSPSETFSLLIAADGNDGDNGLNPYTTLIDEVPNGAVFGAGYRNSDVAADPYDNNTGQVDQTRVTNESYGIAVTADWAATDNLSAKLIVSDRHSEYESGLDDDSFFDNFLSFPETGEADQTSVELQINGNYDPWDFVAGIYYFEEEGINIQNPYTFNGGPGDFLLEQDVESVAAYANVGYNVSDQLRVAFGLRYTEDDKDAHVNINSSLIDETASEDFNELSWDLSAAYEIGDRLTAYGTIANGYQSGQFPPRPFCLFGFLDFSQPGNVSVPNCFAANDNITATNYEVGIKGQPLNNLQMSVAVFFTDYKDLPYQVSTTQVGGFDTRNIIVDQESIGLEWEGLWRISDRFQIQTSLGLIDVDVDDPVAVAPLTPEITAAIGPQFNVPMSGGGELTLRADWSYRDDMFGEPTADPGRFTGIDSRSLINFDFSYEPPDGDWTLGLYGRNVTDKRYDNARLNTGDYILRILSNDASEFGLRFVHRF